MKLKFPLLFALLLFFLELQSLLRDGFGWSPDLALAFLIAAVAFVNLHELLALVLAAMWLLNWQPGLGPELLAFGLIPLAAFIVRKSSPWNIWASAAAFSVAGVGILYLAAGVPSYVFADPMLILDAALTAAAGVVIIWLLREFVGYREERRLFAR